MANKPMLFIAVLLVIALALIVFFQIVMDPFSNMSPKANVQPHVHENDGSGKMSFSEEMKTYGQYCASCHGKFGEGAASFPSLQASSLTIEEIKDIITNGRGDMERIDHIKEPMLTKLAEFVKKL